MEGWEGPGVGLASRTVLSSVKGLGVYVPGVTGPTRQEGRAPWEGASPPGWWLISAEATPKEGPLAAASSHLGE